METPTSSGENQIQRKVSDRWTPALSSGGWTPISDFFLDNYRNLPQPLSTSEVMLVIHLIRHKWTQAAPFPSFKRIAARMGITPTAVRNHARTLEQKGLVKRESRSGHANRFDLQPLFRALEELQASQRTSDKKADVDEPF